MNQQDAETALRDLALNDPMALVEATLIARVERASAELRRAEEALARLREGTGR